MLRDQTAAVHRKHRSQKKQDAKESDNRTKVMSSSSGSSKALISTNGSTVQPSTSEIYFPVSSPFPRSLNQPLEETAISFFFQLISVAQKDPQTLNGFIELLPLVYSNAKSSPHLHLATAAVSLFSVAAWTGDHSLIRLSELCFFRAISRTRVAIGNSAECNSDETLMAVLLLSRYEVSREPRSRVHISAMLHQRPSILPSHYPLFGEGVVLTAVTGVDSREGVQSSRENAPSWGCCIS